jgi:hypothetical protein
MAKLPEAKAVEVEAAYSKLTPSDSRCRRAPPWSLRSWPALTPLWCVADGGTLYLTTGFAIRAATNIARTPDVALLLVGEHVRTRRRAVPVRSCRHTMMPVRTRGVVSSVVAVNPPSHPLAKRAQAEAVKHRADCRSPVGERSVLAVHPLLPELVDARAWRVSFDGRSSLRRLRHHVSHGSRRPGSGHQPHSP